MKLNKVSSACVTSKKPTFCSYNIDKSDYSRFMSPKGRKAVQVDTPPNDESFDAHEIYYGLGNSIVGSTL